MDSRLTQPVEEFGKSAGEYIDLRIDELKLKTAKGLSVTLHRILLAVLFLSLGGILLPKLFINGLVKMFIGLFFEEKDEEEED